MEGIELLFVNLLQSLFLPAVLFIFNGVDS